MIVYIDMDGVVADFDGHFLELYNQPLEEMTQREKDDFWDSDCVADKFFAEEPVISEGIEMVTEIHKLGIPLSFLTSTGGGINHCEIARQKLDFLERVGFRTTPVAFANSTKTKAMHAHLDAYLIDDREKVVDAFIEAGGAAWLFKRDRWEEAVEWVKKWVDTAPC